VRDTRPAQKKERKRNVTMERGRNTVRVGSGRGGSALTHGRKLALRGMSCGGPIPDDGKKEKPARKTKGF